MKLFFISMCIIYLSLVQQTFSNDQEYNPEYEEQIYKQLFKRRRTDQLEAIKGFKKLTNYEKQYTMILVLAKKIFNVIESSRALLEASDYVPGHSSFPKDEKIRDALSHILENAALFGEIILRFPEISETTLKDNNEWNVLFQWSIGFCNESQNLLDKNTITLFNLVSQELNYVERDPKYKNPYRKHVKNARVEEPVENKKKKRKEIKKGPRMTDGRSDL